MNRLNHKIRKARREMSYLRGLVKLRKGGLKGIDSSVEESYAKMREEIWFLVAIRETIRKGYRRETE